MVRAKTIAAAVALLALGASCSRQQPTVEPPIDTAALAATRAEREALFGTEALAADVNWRVSGLGYRILAPGSGARPGLGATVRINYLGRLKDGTLFDETRKPADLPLGRLLPGLATGLQLLNTGGRAVFFVPPKLGYGGAQVMGIPPNSGLIFEAELIAVNP